MTLTMVLVSALPLSDDALTAACTTTAAALGEWELVGRIADDDIMVELSAEVSDHDLLLQLFPSRRLDGAQLATLSTELGVTPPSADTNWLTELAMSGRATEPQTVAVVGVVGQLATALRGYLVMGGEVVDLPGVSAPTRAAPTPDPAGVAPAEVSPRNGVLAAFADLETFDDPERWRRTVQALKPFAATSFRFAPVLLEREGAWVRFEPSNPEPPDFAAGWPVGLRLANNHADDSPPVVWDVTPGVSAVHRLTSISATGGWSPVELEAYLPALRQLGAAYGFIHYWSDDQPETIVGLRRGSNAPLIRLASIDLDRTLPAVYWAQLFGPRWTREVGADTLRTAPGHRVDEVGPDTWLVQVTEHLTDVIDDPEGFAARRDAVAQHLGARHFSGRFPAHLYPEG